MNKTNLKFKILDIFYIVMMVAPLLFGIILNMLTEPPAEGITVTGARIYFGEAGLFTFCISEAQINSLLVTVTILFVCLYLAHGVSERINLKRQHFAELIVEKVDGLVNENMGEYFKS